MNERAEHIVERLTELRGESRRERERQSEDGRCVVFAIDQDLVNALGTVLDELTGPRIEVVELAGRQAILVSGGTLPKYTIESLERFMLGEGKLVVLELEGEGGEPGYRETYTRDNEGKLTRA